METFIIVYMVVYILLLICKVLQGKQLDKIGNRIDKLHLEYEKIRQQLNN